MSFFGHVVSVSVICRPNECQQRARAERIKNTQSRWQRRASDDRGDSTTRAFRWLAGWAGFVLGASSSEHNHSLIHSLTHSGGAMFVFNEYYLCGLLIVIVYLFCRFVRQKHAVARCTSRGKIRPLPFERSSLSRRCRRIAVI